MPGVTFSNTLDVMKRRYRYVYEVIRLIYGLIYRSPLGYHFRKLINGVYVHKALTAFLIFGFGYIVGSVITWAYGVCHEQDFPAPIPDYGSNFQISQRAGPENTIVNSIFNQNPNISPNQKPNMKELPNYPRNKKYLITLIFSSPSGVQMRNVIRSTWLKTAERTHVSHFFAIGTGKLPSHQIASLEGENQTNGDLLLLPMVQDSYSGLTFKLLMSIKWISRHYNFDFLLKVDDDSFVQLEELINILHHMKYKNRVYMGFFDGHGRIKRDGKWAEKRWFLCDRYLPHALGGGYVISSDLVRFIDTNSDLLSLYNNEDVSMGTWLAPLHIKRIHDPRFDTEYQSRGCMNTYIVTHKQDMNQMKEKFYNLKHSNKLCTTEFKLHNSYVYNWHVLPSKCCQRNNASIP